VANAAAARKGDRTPAADAADAGDFAELRSLIVGPEQRQLRTIQSRLDDPATQARDVSRVLPVAMLLRKDDPQMTRALAPTVEEAITSSVRRNPRPLADALFPIFGPAIRKAIAASLSSMLESLNQTLEHSVSWRALQWRVTALRTGKSFAEVVLLNTLLYRVEQVFLIERESGLLLQHVRSAAVRTEDADMVAGMLTAIRDFARDSFRVADDETLDNFRIGELSVWVEQGPHAILAVVIRGNAPGELRERMQEALEHVHARMGDALASFSGDTAPFEVVQPALESCLESRYQPPRKGIPPVVWIAVAGLVIAIGAWMYLAYEARARWNWYLDALRAEPGVVVVSSDRRDGRYVVSGLRDPLARDPASLLGAAGLSEEDVAGQWELYQALEPSIVLARARQLLQAPESVTFSVDGGTLTAAGAAPVGWIRESRRLAPLVPGVSRFDTASLVDAELRRIGDELSSSPLLFVRGTMNVEAGTETALTAHLERLRQLDALAELAGGPLFIEIVGHADGDGSPQTNDSLSVSRANVVRSAIEALRLPNIRTTARGVGSSQPASAGTTESDKRANRRVTLQVVRPR
jgi:outer membrane protein OmpA-like peptidoglycan-associated protein